MKLIELDPLPAHLSAHGRHPGFLAVSAFGIEREVSLELRKRHEAIDEPERGAGVHAPFEDGLTVFGARRLEMPSPSSIRRGSSAGVLQGGAVPSPSSVSAKPLVRDGERDRSLWRI